MVVFQSCAVSFVLIQWPGCLLVNVPCTKWPAKGRLCLLCSVDVFVINRKFTEPLVLCSTF